MLFAFLLSLNLFAQEYSEIIEVPGKSTDQLYVSARQWFAKTFVSSNEVLQMDDPVAGKLIGKGSTSVDEICGSLGMIKVAMTIQFTTNFTISVAVKDGRYKCDVTNLLVSRSLPGNELNTTDEKPYSYYLSKKEYFKNGSDPEWLVSNNDFAGNKVSKSRAKQISSVNYAYYNLILGTDENIKAIMISLQEAMKATEADW